MLAVLLVALCSGSVCWSVHCVGVCCVVVFCSIPAHYHCACCWAGTWRDNVKVGMMGRDELACLFSLNFCPSLLLLLLLPPPSLPLSLPILPPSLLFHLPPSLSLPPPPLTQCSLVPAATLTVSQPKRAITAPIDTTKHTPPPISKEMFLKLQTEARRKEMYVYITHHTRTSLMWLLSPHNLIYLHVIINP